MTTYDHHRDRALTDLVNAEDSAEPNYHLARAQVHATLALAAATAPEIDDAAAPIDLVPADRPPIRSIYVASSWRNLRQPSVVAILQDEGLDVYDFKNPAGSTGFRWADVGLPVNADGQADRASYLWSLNHPRAVAGYQADFDAMQAADAFVLVLPCGRSAHLELGWAVGQGKRTAILLDGPLVVPELMYRMVDHLATTTQGLLTWIEENQ